MQFPYEGRIVNLLDTPGHEDFSEDTYRTLTAVDSALMVIDCAKGVEERTIKLMEVCRLRDTPIMTFINKLDRDGRAPIELLDEIETRARHPVRAGDLADRHGPRALRGIYHLGEDRIYVYDSGRGGRVGTNRAIDGLASEAAEALLGDRAAALREEIELVRGAIARRSTRRAYLAGQQTPVFFGSAINNFGVAGAARLLRRARAAAARRARPRRARSSRRRPRSPASCSRSRRTWIPASRPHRVPAHLLGRATGAA